VTSLALISVRGCVDLSTQCGWKKISQWIFRITPTGIELATFWLEMQYFNQLHHSVPHLYCVFEVNDNKEINVNPSLFYSKYQNTNCGYPIYIQISRWISTGANFMSEQTVCEMQYCVWKLCWGGTGGKMLQSVPVHNSDTLRDMHCDVCAVYWRSKNTVVPVVGKCHE
jgi:hypothetical protein